MEIEKLPPLDMTSDEVRTFYAVEIIDQKGALYVEVFGQPDTRDMRAGRLAAPDRKPQMQRVATYEVVAPITTDIADVQAFAQDNARIHKEV